MSINFVLQSVFIASLIPAIVLNPKVAIVLLMAFLMLIIRICV